MPAISALRHRPTVLAACSVAFLAALLADWIRTDPRLYNSDLLYLPTLWLDLTSWGGNLSQWHLPPAPYVFPDMLLYFPLQALIGNLHVALALAGVVQFALFVGGWILLARLLFPRDAAFAVGLVLLVSAVLLAVPRLALLTLPFFRLTTHFGVCLAAPYLLVLSTRAMRSGFARGRVTVAIAAIAALLTFSDATFVFQIGVPLAAAFVTLALAGRMSRRGARRYAGAVLGGIVAGALLGPLLLPSRSMGLYLRPEDIGRAAGVVLDIVRYHAAHDPYPTSIVAAALAAHLAAGVYLLARARGEEGRDAELAILSAFVVWSAAIDVGSGLVTGLFFDLGGIRYFFPLLLFPVFGLSMLVSRVLAGRRPAALPFLLAGAVVVIATCAPALRRASELARYRDYYPPFVECLDRETEKRGLADGVATYWDAKYASALSKRGLHIIQITGELKHYNWISNEAWYRRFPPQFVIIDRNAQEPYRISPAMLAERFGPPADRFTCEGHEIFVYDRESDTAFREAFAGSK